MARSPQQASLAAAPPRRVRLCARTADDAPYSNPITVDELRDVCRGMLNALDEECRAAGAAAVGLGPGERLRVVGSGSVYRFTLSTPLDSSEGDPVLFRLGEREVDGVIATCTEREVQLTLNDDVGHTVRPGGELLLDAPWLVLRLRQRIRDAFEIGHGTPRLFNLPTALRTLGIGEIEVGATGTNPEYENERRPLNEAQSHAVEVGLRAPVSLIAAPAGTGKTLTLGALVEACYRAGLRTLVTAPSNVAVDLQMMQVCERLSWEDGFAAAEVLRLGADAGAGLRAAFGRDVVLDEVVARVRPKLLERIRRAQGVVDQLAEALTAAQLASSPDAGGEVKRLRRELAEARAELRRLRQELRDFGRSMTAEARVVGATLARIFLDSHVGLFDVVVIDEASMAQGPAVFIAGGLARRHLVLAGDPFQLAAPVLSTGPNRHWLAVDVFQRLDILSAIRHEESVPYLTQLEEQRRCAESICELQRELWYGPGLRTAREVFARERARHNVIWGTSSLCFVDTSALNARAHHPWGRTYANDQHAQLIADLIAYIDSAGELPPPGAGSSELTVLSHYRGQVANIRRQLGNRYRDRGVNVRTVHRAQGAECTTCIFDLTLAPNVPTRVSSVLTASRPEEDGSRLLAVAASRARSRFVFVGDMEWVARAVARESVLGRICEHLVQNGYSIPLHDIQGRIALPHLRMVR